eukprot:GHVP01028652.1.p1 GENE.GHVP01028652.1~~GHVP01028652.1.p1  ORF type:complete len:261 (-),score=61.92 GHVP01028652.1:198-980(-)
MRDRARSPIRRNASPTNSLGSSAVDIQQLLEELLPSRRWNCPGSNEVWVQRVSSVPATPMHLNEVLVKLKDRVAKIKSEDLSKKEIFGKFEDMGIASAWSCSGTSSEMRQLMRERLNEAIRQVTISCANQGKMMAKIKQEFDEIVSSYEELTFSRWHFALQSCLKLKRDQRDRRKRIRVAEDRLKVLNEMKNRLLVLVEQKKQKGCLIEKLSEEKHVHVSVSVTKEMDKTLEKTKQQIETLSTDEILSLLRDSLTTQTSK